MEPMQKARKLEGYRKKIGMLHAFVNVSNKIWVFVDEDHGVDFLINMEQQMTMKLTNMDTQVSFIVMFSYAKCDAIECIELWDNMYNLARDMSLPWLVKGDFNVIWDEEEKFGGLPVSLNEVNDFRHCINICNLTDLGFKGRSDHNPILLTCIADATAIKKAFKFLNIWTKHHTFTDLVKENWKADFVGDPFFTFNYKLKRLKKALSTWSRATYGDIFQKIASLEEINGRRKRLQLKRVQNDASNWLEDKAEMADEAVRFDQTQFHEDSVPTAFGILDHVSAMVDNNQNL
ncbi:uncharacterized protein [Nicotiana tomentosiformis]|uniref:uncharacterized protein n=1 Tax=Nicotiana tomentosiformis TaxID=4098 RepID=UPI00388CEB52